MHVAHGLVALAHRGVGFAVADEKAFREQAVDDGFGHPCGECVDGRSSRYRRRGRAPRASASSSSISSPACGARATSFTRARTACVPAKRPAMSSSCSSRGSIMTTPQRRTFMERVAIRLSFPIALLYCRARRRLQTVAVVRHSKGEYRVSKNTVAGVELDKILDRMQNDAAFREKLLGDPAAALAEHGVDVDPATIPAVRTLPPANRDRATARCAEVEGRRTRGPSVFSAQHLSGRRARACAVRAAHRDRRSTRRFRDRRRASSQRQRDRLLARSSAASTAASSAAIRFGTCAANSPRYSATARPRWSTSQCAVASAFASSPAARYACSSATRVG